MFNIYLFDDNNIFRDKINLIVRDFIKGKAVFNDTLIHSVSSGFKNYIESLEHTESRSLYVVDINLNEDIDGLNLAKLIREKDFEGYIIFMTSHLEWVTLSYNMNLKALNYIYKGDEALEEKLISSLDQIEHELLIYGEKEQGVQANKNTKVQREAEELEDRTTKETILVSFGHEHYKLVIDEVYFVETHPLKRNILIHTSDKDIRVNSSLNDIMKKLPNTFIRSHKSYIVNSTKINELHLKNNGYEAVLINDAKCPVSKQYYKDVVNAFKEV